MQRELQNEFVQQTVHQYQTGTIHDPDFRAFSVYPVFREVVRTIIDVGANRGQSIISLGVALPDARIHAFEANPFFHSILKDVVARLHLPVTVYEHGLGKTDETLRFYIPHSQGVAYLQETSSRLDYFEKPWIKEKFNERGGVTFQVFDALIRRGDDLAIAPDLIKIDVEGAEFDVLVGLEQTIGRSRPILLIENGDWEHVTTFLLERGYSVFVFANDQLVPISGPTTNSFYIPNERITALGLSQQGAQSNE
jgi:FkbM family methyltransferase